MPHRYDLGKGPWSNPDGCGQGEGELHLRIKYTPFDRFTRHPRESLTVRTAARRINIRRVSLHEREVCTTDNEVPCEDSLQGRHIVAASVFGLQRHQDDSVVCVETSKHKRHQTKPSGTKARTSIARMTLVPCNMRYMHKQSECVSWNRCSGGAAHSAGQRRRAAGQGWHHQ